MIIPVRCFGCNKPIAHLWEKFKEKVAAGASKKEALDEVGLKRYCCRAIFLGHVDLVETVARFRKS